MFTLDGTGGQKVVFQETQVGPGVAYDFATTSDLPLIAPTILLAREVRGQ